MHQLLPILPSPYILYLPTLLALLTFLNISTFLIILHPPHSSKPSSFLVLLTLHICLPSSLLLFHFPCHSIPHLPHSPHPPPLPSSLTIDSG